MESKEQIVHCPKFGAFVGLDVCKKGVCIYCNGVEEEKVFDKETNTMKPTGELVVNCSFPTRRKFYVRLGNESHAEETSAS